jgi:hypothetical protein
MKSDFSPNKKLIYLGVATLVIVIIELLVFNQKYLTSRLDNVEEKHFSIYDGVIYQFKIDNGTLIALNSDPNITFDNINTAVNAVLIECINSIPGAAGQVFFRGEDESFSETQSIQYDASSREPVLLDFSSQGDMVISSLRFDLTNMPNDTITCSDFVINPSVPFRLKPARLMVYFGILFILIFYFFGLPKIALIEAKNSGDKRGKINFKKDQPETKAKVAVPLGIPDVRVLQTFLGEDGEIIIIVVESTKEGISCRKCGKWTTKLNGYDDWVTVEYLPAFGRSTYLRYRPERYECQTCEGGPTTRLNAWDGTEKKEES